MTSRRRLSANSVDADPKFLVVHGGLLLSVPISIVLVIEQQMSSGGIAINRQAVCER